MDLGKLSTLNSSNEGVWVQVELYGEKQDFELCILGEDSDKVFEFTKNKLKKLRKNVKGGELDLDDEAMENILDTANEDVVVRLNGIRSLDGTDVTLNGKTLKNDEKSYTMLVENIPAIKEFITGISKDRTNFLLKEKKN